MRTNKIKTDDVANFLKGKKIIETSNEPVGFSSKQSINMLFDSGDKISIYGDDMNFSILTREQIIEILNCNINKTEEDLKQLRDKLKKTKELLK